MSNNEENSKPLETPVSRPSPLMIVILIGIVVGFFVVAFSADKIEAHLSGQSPPAASTQTQ